MPEFIDFSSNPFDYYSDDDADHLYSQPDSDWDPLTAGLSYDAVTDELLLELMPF